jgi:hypothetical protein
MILRTKWGRLVYILDPYLFMYPTSYLPRQVVSRHPSASIQLLPPVSNLCLNSTFLTVKIALWVCAKMVEHAFFNSDWIDKVITFAASDPFPAKQWKIVRQLNEIHVQGDEKESQALGLFECGNPLDTSDSAVMKIYMQSVFNSVIFLSVITRVDADTKVSGYHIHLQRVSHTKIRLRKHYQRPK